MSNGIRALSRRPAFCDSSKYSTSIQGREHSMGNCTSETAFLKSKLGWTERGGWGGGEESYIQEKKKKRKKEKI